MSTKIRQRASTALIAVPLLFLGAAALVYVRGGNSHHHKTFKPNKPHYRTYVQAGADLQQGYEEPLRQGGYDFQVVACAHDKGYKYACSAFVTKSGHKYCTIVKFNDKPGKAPDVTDAAEAKDSSVCK